MKTINFLFQAFGFADVTDFKISTFGFIISVKFLKWASVAAFLTSIVQAIFGFSWQFLLAYVLLVIFEWITGVKASARKGQKHESRKLGRMLFKILVYTLIIFLLNMFRGYTQFPVVFGYELDPFHWLYWMSLLVIIWQLFVSLLENLDVLGFAFASKLIKVINKKFYKLKDLDINE
ncbi:MAG: phage holin family protein [Urechidicola sp.]|nr:phage holin family protein [Urechidicola sp.]